MNTEDRLNNLESENACLGFASRRTVLRGAMLGGVGFALASMKGINALADSSTTGQIGGPAPAQATQGIQTTLNNAITAEYIAVTFLTNAIANAATLGFPVPQPANVVTSTPRETITVPGIPGTFTIPAEPGGLTIPGLPGSYNPNGTTATVSLAMGTKVQPLAILTAALAEENDHLIALQNLGGVPAATTFSFPAGPATFTDLPTFLNAMVALETFAVAAYLAAIQEFMTAGRSDLVKLAAEIMGVEAEHRALARQIGGLNPPNNISFENTSFASTTDAAKALQSQGFLSPSGANVFAFPASLTVDATGVTQRTA